MRSLVAALIGVALVAALTGCGGESEEEKAQNQVCDARADIRAQVDTLEGLPLSPDSIDEAQTSLTAIRDDLRKIADAQEDLDPDRKAQVQAATKTFTSELETAAKSVLSAGVSGAEAAARSALQKLGAAYEQALAPIACD